MADWSGGILIGSVWRSMSVCAAPALVILLEARAI